VVPLEFVPAAGKGIGAALNLPVAAGEGAAAAPTLGSVLMLGPMTPLFVVVAVDGVRLAAIGADGRGVAAELVEAVVLAAPL